MYNEIWKDIKGFEGKYQVSNLARIKSIKRKYAGERILKTGIDKDGYVTISLKSDNKSYLLKVHRLVAEAFIPNPDNLPCVNHKNEIKTDNRVDNLEWCNVSYNNSYGSRKNLNFKPVLQFSKCGEFVCEYISTVSASKTTSIHHQSISACCRGERKSAGGYIWKYKGTD